MEDVLKSVEGPLKRVRARTSSKFKAFTIPELQSMGSAIYYLLSYKGEPDEKNYGYMATPVALKNLKTVADQWYQSYGSDYGGGSASNYGTAKLPDEVLAKVDGMFKVKPKPRAKKAKLTAPVQPEPISYNEYAKVFDPENPKITVGFNPSPTLTDDDIPF